MTAVLLISPSLAAAEPCVEITLSNGEPAYQLLGPTGSGSRWIEIEEKHCRECGGEWSQESGGMRLADETQITNWCKRKPSSGGGAKKSAGYDPKQMRLLDQAVSQYVASGTVDQATAMGGAFEAGVALNAYFARSKAQADIKRQVELGRRREEERRRQEEDMRRRTESWNRLRTEMKLSSAAGLDLQLESTHHELSMKFDGADSALSDPANAELMAKGGSNCFFMDCASKYEMPMESWVSPYREERHLRRAVALARRVQYAPGDQREAILEQIIPVGYGEHPGTEIPDDGIVLPPNALDVMQDRSVVRKLVTDDRMKRQSALDDATHRRDTAEVLVDEAKNQADEAERRVLLTATQKELKKRETEVAKARMALDEAKKRETEATARERQTVILLATTRSAGGPVALCAEEQMIIDRLKAGLPTQQKAIQSTRAQLRSARADAASSRAKARDLGLEKIVDEMSEEMTDYLKNVDAAKFGAPGAIPDAVRKDLGELIVEFDQMRSLLADFKKAAKAGHEYGKVLAERSHGLAQKMALLNEKLDEAGLWSEAGETVAKIGFGSAGASAFKMAELSIRLSVEIGGALVSDAEARQHEANLAIMEGQSRRIAGEIAEREARLRDVHTRNGCL